MASKVGGPGPDVLVGTNAADTLQGLGGADDLFGLGGADNLQGGGGADDLSGGAGRDTLSGGAGADNLTGDQGNDTLTGGAGADDFRFVEGVNGGIDTIIDWDNVIGNNNNNGDQLEFVGSPGFYDTIDIFDNQDLDNDSVADDVLVRYGSGSNTGVIRILNAAADFSNDTSPPIDAGNNADDILLV